MKLIYDMHRAQYEQIHEFVINGAKLLDRVEPDWFKSIKLELLDVASAFTCILGQLYGGFATGGLAIGKFIPGWREQWIDNIDLLADHGFTGHPGRDIAGSWHQDMALLTNAWRSEIEDRRRSQHAHSTS